MKKSIADFTEREWNTNQKEWYEGQVKWYKEQISLAKQAGTLEFIDGLQKSLRHNRYMAKKFAKKLGE